MRVFAVVALIRRKDGLILATSRRNKPGEWGLPGGKVEPGEDSFDALRREVKEETGIEIEGGWYLSERIVPEGKVIYYEVKEYQDNPSQQDSEIGVAWVLPVDLVSGPFGKYNVELLKRIGMWT